MIFEKSAYKWDEKHEDQLKRPDGRRAFGFILNLLSIRDKLVAGIERLTA